MSDPPEAVGGEPVPAPQPPAAENAPTAEPPTSGSLFQLVLISLLVVSILVVVWWIVGKLAKDDGTVNIIAEEVRPLKLRHPRLEMTYTSASPSPTSFLKNLRRSAPGSRDWG